MDIHLGQKTFGAGFESKYFKDCHVEDDVLSSLNL